LALDEESWELVNFLEQEWLAKRALPTADRLSDIGFSISTESYTKFLDRQDVRTALLGRGVPLSILGGGKHDVLTEEQLTAANVMLDLRDNRSQKKKLQDLGVSSQKWQAWLRDPAFQNYLRQRAEGILGDNQHEAANALVDRVRSGDVNAIKFYYEITGRHVSAPQGGNSPNFPALLMRVMEIIQKHVSDTEIVNAIAEDFLVLAQGVSVGVGTTPMIAPTRKESTVPMLPGGVIDL